MSLTSKYDAHIVALCQREQPAVASFHAYIFSQKTDPYLALECAAFHGSIPYLNEICTQVAEYNNSESPLDKKEMFLAIRRGALFGDKVEVYSWGIQKGWYAWQQPDVILAAKMGSRRILAHALAKLGATPELMLEAAVHHKEDHCAEFWVKKIRGDYRLNQTQLGELVRKRRWSRLKILLMRNGELTQRKELFTMVKNMHVFESGMMTEMQRHLEWEFPLTEAVVHGWIDMQSNVPVHEFSEKDWCYASQMMDLHVGGEYSSRWARNAPTYKYLMDPIWRDLGVFRSWALLQERAKKEGNMSLLYA